MRLSWLQDDGNHKDSRSTETSDDERCDGQYESAVDTNGRVGEGSRRIPESRQSHTGRAAKVTLLLNDKTNFILSIKS